MKAKIIAISGVKNSGKTTLISRLIPKLKKRGLKIGTIKHDGHDFEPDVKGTDSYIHRSSGADGTVIYSSERYMIIKEEKNIDINILLEEFRDYDLIILEGFKFSDFPKIELIRNGVSDKPITNRKRVIAYISDLDIIDENIQQFGFDGIDKIEEYIYNNIIKK